MTDRLVEILRAKLREDEAIARASEARNGSQWTTEEVMNGCRINGTTDKGHPRAYSGSPELWDDEGALGMFPETATHVARHDPERVLRVVQAMRQILDLHTDCTDEQMDGLLYTYCTEDEDAWPCETVKALASIYLGQREWSLQEDVSGG